MCDPTYLDWCHHHRIAMHGVEPAFVAEGWRGVVATQPLAPGHIVMTVPEALLMSVLSAQRDPQLSLALQQHQLSSHQVVTLHLLHEASKGPVSVWAPYIQQLPRHYTTCANWGPAAVEAMQLQHAQAAASAAITKARQEWTTARPVLQQLGVAKKWCSWRAWQWASSAVLSRTMYHPADPPCGCLTPLGDLHNYAPPPAPHTPDLGSGLQQLLQELKPQQAKTQQQQQEQEQQEHGAGAAEEACGQQQCSCQQQEQQQGVHLSEPQQQQQQQVAAEQQPCSAVSCNSNSNGLQADGMKAAAAGSSNSSSNSNGCNSTASISGDGHFDEAEGCYKIVARRSYRPGDQVFLCYGRHTNLELLELYGFLLPVPDSNPHDTALLPVQLLQQHLQQAYCLQQQQQQQECVVGRSPWRRQPQKALQQKQEQQQQVQQQVQLDVAAADCWVHVTGQPSWQLLSALRFAAASPTEAKTLGYKAFSGDPISFSSELLALQALAAACRAQLATLPTSAEDDALLLQQQPQRLTDGSTPADKDGTSAVGGSSALGQAASAGDAMQQQQEKPQQASQEGVERHECSSCCEQQAAGGVKQQDNQQQQVECVALAVQWRHAYKQALLACVDLCERVLSQHSTVDPSQ